MNKKTGTSRGTQLQHGCPCCTSNSVLLLLAEVHLTFFTIVTVHDHHPHHLEEQEGVVLGDDDENEK